MITHQNYLYRMTVLAAIVALAPNVPREVLSNAMLPAAVACSKVRLGRAFFLFLHFFSFPVRRGICVSNARLPAGSACSNEARLEAKKSLSGSCLPFSR